MRSVDRYRKTSKKLKIAKSESCRILRFFRLIRVNSRAGSKKVSGPGDPKWPEMPEKSKTKICHPPYPLTNTKMCDPPDMYKICHPPYTYKICHPLYPLTNTKMCDLPTHTKFVTPPTNTKFITPLYPLTSTKMCDPLTYKICHFP